TPSDLASVAWLSLDEQDNHPAIFWTYIIAALQRASPVVGATAAAYLQSGQSPEIQEVLITLINEVSGSTNDVVLVLDDYHVIDLPEIHEAMTFLLDHLPPLLHLAIASRSQPPLPLARLRARGELVELRAADLRFKAEETAAYFNGVMDLGLTAPDLDALDGRTEGWIAALQLAALSMQGRDDVSSFIESFAGDNRYIVDYLVQEVLQRQRENVRNFLLRTAILDRLNGALCDAVTGQEDGQGTLRSLEQGNVLVVPLDDRRDWYRYHHLFADVLRAHLVAEQPDSVHDLHRRASLWFEQNGDWPEAIRHALAAGDFERAADLIEFALPDMLRTRQETTLRSWLDALPDRLVRLRPVLSAGFVSVLLHSGDLESVETRLQAAERSLATACQSSRRQEHALETPVFVDEEQFRELPGMIALYRAGFSQVRGNLSDTVTYARLALDLMPAEHPLRGGALALLGLALWASGDLEAAHKTYAEGIARVHVGGYVHDSSTIMLADMQVAQGHLRAAQRAYERSLQRATEQGNAAPRGTADMHVGLSEIYREQGDLEAATRHLIQSNELGTTAGLPENRYRWFIAMAGVKHAQQDLDGALDLLDQAERLFAPGFSPDVRPISALRTRVWLAQGRFAEALEWVREQGLSVDDDLSYLREFQHLTLARVLIAQSEQDGDSRPLRAAEGLLERLLEAAEAGGRTGSIIEILILKAIVQRAMRDVPAGLIPLHRALALAGPEGYVRIFVDEGRPVAILLERLSKDASAGHARRLLKAFQHTGGKTSVGQSPFEPLSERELEVLRLLGTDLSGPDIASELVVSLNTMRTHTKSIYTKLGVNSRREAVRRAQELDLI
ncbi:MAG: LuxR C-terminal-related transcriptional regulator, partial [Dehalococcoidia bacterium]